MSKELVDRIRKNRELKVKVGGFTFRARRPTSIEFDDLYRRSAHDSEIASDFVIGFESEVIEDDVVGGGGSDKVEFHPQLWREWCAERREFWGPIAQAVLEAYGEREKTLKATEKNSASG